MPARVTNGTSSTAPMRFELPALNLDLGSITDGTNIPPPPDSPAEKPASKPANGSENTKESAAADKSGEKNGAVAPEPPAKGQNGNLAGKKRPADGNPPSPTLSGRQGSVRRLLSRTFLSNSYTEGNLTNLDGAATNGSRPTSRGGASSFVDDRKSKRSSGWFKRLRGSDNKRSSLIFEQQSGHRGSVASTKPSGPPPPMIPELKDLEKDEGSLGGDLFKNIK